MEEDLEKDMTPKLIGETFRKYPTEKSKYEEIFGIYECRYCGKEFECRRSNIQNGHTKSCGCHRRVYKLQTHGLGKNRFYHTWINMIKRCTIPNNKDYINYGGRGIVVCEEWLDVTTFVAWAESTHPNIAGYTLDRIDNDKGYSPENCRWADASTQGINRRMPRNNTSGYMGVSWYARDKDWRASITVNNKLIDLGYFKTKEEAVQARDNYIIKNKLSYKLSSEY